MFLSIKVKGNFKNTEKFLNSVRSKTYSAILDAYGRKGVDMLSKATPVDTGETAESWNYRVEKIGGNYKLTWYNTNVNKGVNVAIILQYGHATGTGGWVEGIDYINPALKPIFEALSKEIWEEVKR